MALLIAEPRVDCVDELLAFAQSHDSHPPPTKVVLSLSLVAHEDEQLTGAAIFYHNPRGLACLDVVFAQADVPTPLIQQLVDKALLKLQSSNICKCTLLTPGQTNPQRFWKAAEWNTESFDLAPSLENRPEQETVDSMPNDEAVPTEAA